jgi:hypothetical protein
MNRSSLVLALALVSGISLATGSTVFAAETEARGSADGDQDVVAGYAAPYTEASVNVGQSPTTNVSTVGATVTATQTGPLASGFVTSSLGSLDVEAHVINSSSDGGGVAAYGISSVLYTFTGVSGQGSADFTYYVSGSYTGSNLAQNQGNNSYAVNGTVRGTIRDDTVIGVLPPQTYIEPRIINFNQPYNHVTTLS